MLTDAVAQYMTFIKKQTYSLTDDTHRDMYSDWKCICFDTWSPPLAYKTPKITSETWSSINIAV